MMEMQRGHTLAAMRAQRMRGPAAIPIIAAAAPVVMKGIGSLMNKGGGPNTNITQMPGYQGALGSAGDLRNMGSNLYRPGMDALGQSMGYFSTMLGRGGTSAIRRATEGTTSGIMNRAQGITRSISGRTGTEALQRNATMNAAAGDVNRTVAGAPMEAATALGQLGGQATGQGISATQGAGGIYSSLLGQGANMAQFLAQLRQGSQAGLGQGVGNLLSQFITAKYGGVGTTPVTSAARNNGVVAPGYGPGTVNNFQVQ